MAKADQKLNFLLKIYSVTLRNSIASWILNPTFRDKEDTFNDFNGRTNESALNIKASLKINNKCLKLIKTCEYLSLVTG